MKMSKIKEALSLDTQEVRNIVRNPTDESGGLKKS